MKRRIDATTREPYILDERSEFTDWREKIGLALTEKYGALGNFIEDEVHYEEYFYAKSQECINVDFTCLATSYVYSHYRVVVCR
jgi:hypothetical protein